MEAVIRPGWGGRSLVYSSMLARSSREEKRSSWPVVWAHADGSELNTSL